MEATDRFGSVLTLRLVRRGHNDQRSSYSATASVAANGRPKNHSEGWGTRLARTEMEARKTLGDAPSTDFKAGALCSREQTSHESGEEGSNAYVYQRGRSFSSRLEGFMLRSTSIISAACRRCSNLRCQPNLKPKTLQGGAPAHCDQGFRVRARDISNCRS